MNKYSLVNTKFGLIFCKLIIVFPVNKNGIALYYNFISSITRRFTIHRRTI